MPRIFNRIRKQLAIDNKFFQYSRYAIGEILLVVIGILIALQIDNWNEERKGKQKEMLFLKEFQGAINTDLYNYEMRYTPRLERKKRGLDSLMAYIYNQKDIHDTLFIRYYIQMRQGIRLGYSNGPYEALKSTGLDFIKNDSLRSAINDTYALLPFFMSFSHQRDDGSNARINELEYNFLNHSAFEQEDGSKSLGVQLKVNDVINNQDFLWVYDLEERKYEEYITRLQQMTASLKFLKDKIDEELKERDPFKKSVE